MFIASQLLQTTEPTVTRENGEYGIYWTNGSFRRWSPFRASGHGWYSTDEGANNTFYRHIETHPEGLASVLFAMALNEQRNRQHTDAIAEQNYRLAHPVITAEVDTLKAQQQAEALGATAAQTAKLRELVESKAAAVRRVDELERELALSQGRITNYLDPRIAHIFGEAAQEADKQGYCNVYDQISDAVGIPTRDVLRAEGFMPVKRYDVRVLVRFDTYVNVTVEAGSEDEAIQEADGMSHTDLFEYFDDSNISEGDIVYTDAREAELIEE